jgi:flagellar basal-body rod modification protein FlgD
VSVAFDSVMSKLGITKTANTDAAAKAKSNSGLDMTDFLTLMTAQLKNQDPFEPVDNQQMVAQMAQMSSVSGIAEMNTSLKSMLTRLSATSTGDALGFVGKTVLVDGKTAYPATDGSVLAKATLETDATAVNVSISDASGNVLKTIALGPQEAGDLDIAWDGKTDAGAAAGDGPFTIKATATRPGGTSALTTQVWAPVTSVNLPSDGTDPTLSVLGVGTVKTSAVHQVG